MSEALLGAIVGGLAAFGGSWIAAHYDFKQKREQLKAEARQQRRQVLDEWRDRKVDRFAPFLAAYYAEEARIVEILEDLRQQRSGWQKRIEETLDSEARADDLAILNKSLGWIALLSAEDEADPLGRKASRTFDTLFSQLTAAAVSAKKGQTVAIPPLEQSLEDLRTVITKLSGLLRGEVHPKDTASE